MSKSLFIGGHVSSAGGIHEALPRAKNIGANCVQIFSASPRMWKRTPPTQTTIDRYNEVKQKLSIEKTVIHAIYLLNLASDDEELVRKSREVIEFDLHLNSHINGSGVVVHLGSHLGKGFDAVKERLVHGIKSILSSTPNDSTFLIENSAGQNGKIASDLSEIRWLLDRVDSPRLGWCLDSCHAFSAGYSLENSKFQIPNSKQIQNKNVQTTIQFEEPKNVFDEIQRLHLWEALKVVHVNDSRDPFASGRDRHENIGDGTIGNDVLGSFLSHEAIRSLPLILEVPGIDHVSGPDRENVERVKTLCQ